jgi:hypothetical protein
MLSLTEFYHQLNQSTNLNDRDFPIIEKYDVIIINFDHVFDRDCVLRGTDQLIYQAHKVGHGKRFIFLSEDGSLLKLSGALEIINNIINCFGLTTETCAVISREELHIDNATTINFDSIPYWCATLYKTIKDIEISSTGFTKKFAAWYHRGTFFRLIIARYLQQNYINDSFVSYQEAGVLIDRNLTRYFEDEINWASQYTPIVYDQLFPLRVYNFDMIVGSTRKPYSQYFLEIVCETDILSTSWITEKTIKNLYIGKPFIVFSGPDTLSKLKHNGFLTFSPWIDESYDSIYNTYDRLEAIKREIDRIAAMPYEQINQMHQEMMPIYYHNREIYLTKFEQIGIN